MPNKISRRSLNKWFRSWESWAIPYFAGRAYRLPEMGAQYRLKKVSKHIIAVMADYHRSRHIPGYQKHCMGRKDLHPWVMEFGHCFAAVDVLDAKEVTVGFRHNGQPIKVALPAIEMTRFQLPLMAEQILLYEHYRHGCLTGGENEERAWRAHLKNQLSSDLGLSAGRLERVHSVALAELRLRWTGRIAELQRMRSAECTAGSRRGRGSSESSR